MKLFNKNFKEFGIFLIRFDEGKGIVRCRHTDKEKSIEILNSIDKIKNNNCQIKTLGTSGTIKALVKKYL